METNISIIITEDKKIFRDIVVAELATHGILCLAEADNGEELLKLLRAKKKPDVVLLDLEMPVMNGNKTMEILAANFPQVKVIILSSHHEITLMEHFIAMGAKGYVPKNISSGSIEILVDAIKKVHQGETYLYSA
ncbi:MAG: response regulator transcription factor [Bacteroidia bacterium]|nr:response regulator transcription factor [Bacteroidia bacterium]